MVLDLSQLVVDWARAIEAADVVAYSQRYKTPGIGALDETELVALVVGTLPRVSDEYQHSAREVRYPDRMERCDLCIGLEPDWQWAIEVKPVRFLRSNGDLEDSTIKKLLSPYDDDGSALSDSRRLAASDLGSRRAMLLYGFDYPDRGRKPPRLLEPAIEAYELLARHELSVGPRCTARFGALRHPRHKQGSVFAWEIFHS